MKIDGILTMRKCMTAPFWDIVFEWEDDLSQSLQIPLVHKGKLFCWINALIRKFPFLLPLSFLFKFNCNKTFLVYVMDAANANPLFNHRSIIPVIIDFFIKDDDILCFLERYSKCKALMISSKEAYDKIMSFNPQIPVYHLPLTLSSRYDKNQEQFVKKYDLTLFGRQNTDAFFMDLVNRYEKENPNFEYVYQDVSDMNFQSGYIYKTNKGKIVGLTKTRKEYMDLVGQSKIVIYSTPELGGRKNCYGYNQVTPKFLEFIASFCHVILRYPNNSDTRYFELDKFSKSVDCYNEFKSLMDNYLNQKPNFSWYKRYMSKHYTNSLAERINGL